MYIYIYTIMYAFCKNIEYIEYITVECIPTNI